MSSVNPVRPVNRVLIKLRHFVMGRARQLLARMEAATGLSSIGLLKLDWFRFKLSKYRWLWLRRRMRVADHLSDAVGKHTLEHNLGAFFDNKAINNAVFGMGKRMALLLYPVAALCVQRPGVKVLIVGPRTEDDIFWAWSLGLTNCRGLDLFSYSKLIDVGDMHHMTYEDHSFDVVLLGWVLGYSTAPEVAVAECKRILKPNGLLGIGQVRASQHDLETSKVRANRVNTAEEHIALVGEEVVFRSDPEGDISSDMALIFRVAGEPRVAVQTDRIPAAA